jgi:hypothetical protein
VTIPAVRRPSEIASSLVRALVAALAAPLLLLLALGVRVEVARRRRRGEPPRLLWGPEPLIFIKYWSEAMRERGYDSRTLVHSVFAINTRQDFDLHREDFLRGWPLAQLIRDPVVFAWALLHADVFLTTLDGGLLRAARPLRQLEAPLLRLAGKKLVVSPYGTDILVTGEIGPAEAPLVEDYPWIPERNAAVRRRVDHFARWSNVVVRNWQFGYLPRWDVVWPTQLGIDTERWSDRRPDAPPGAAGGDAPSGGGEVVILHAPNHRHVKGTEHLLRAVDELRAEGLPVRMDLREGRPNAEIREALPAADIVADQFYAGYATFAVEGMASGRPVLSALSGMPAVVRATEVMQRCPIVDTDLSNLADNLRELVTDPARRVRLGRESRKFAVRHHSYRAVADGWERILAHVWRGEPLPAELPEMTRGANA